MRKIALIIGLVMFLVGCSTIEEPSDQEQTQNQETVVDSDALDTTNLDILDPTTMFTDDDKDATYDTSSAVVIDLDTLSTSSSITGVSVGSEMFTIEDEGTYILSGSTRLTLKIDVQDTQNVHLVLNGVTFTTDSFAAIYVYEADEVKITLAQNTVNTLSNSGGFTEDGDVNVDAVIFSRQDLVINGGGSLSINATDGNGVSGNDDLKLYGVSINVVASNHGVEANDSVRIGSSTLVVNAGRDAIQADNSDDVTLGYVYVETSTLTLQAGNDGIQASSVLQIQSGDFKITTFNGVDSTIDESLDESYKGLKADGIVYLANGTYDLNTADDSIHSGMDVIIDAGTYSINTLDDGIHADASVLLNRPVLTILESYEGIEGQVIEINGGTISISSSDDGINASDGSENTGAPGFQGNANSNLVIRINGGLVSIIAGGDGIDSNGNIEMNDGEVYISTNLNGADSGVDFDGTAAINGGTIISTGSSRMAQNFTTATQGSILYTVSTTVAQGTQILVRDQDGNTLIDTVSMGSYNSILISSDLLTVGSTYILSLDGNETSVSVTSAITGVNNGGSGGNQGGPGGRP